MIGTLKCLSILVSVNLFQMASLMEHFINGTGVKPEDVLLRLEARWSRPASIALDGNKRHVLWKTPYGNIGTLI